MLLEPCMLNVAYMPELFLSQRQQEIPEYGKFRIDLTFGNIQKDGIR